MAKSEFKNFDKALRKILSITSTELREREENWKKERGRPKGKKAVNALASAPVSCVQD